MFGHTASMENSKMHYSKGSNLLGQSSFYIKVMPMEVPDKYQLKKKKIIKKKKPIEEIPEIRPQKAQNHPPLPRVAMLGANKMRVKIPKRIQPVMRSSLNESRSKRSLVVKEPFSVMLSSRRIPRLRPSTESPTPMPSVIYESLKPEPVVMRSINAKNKAVKKANIQ